MESVMIKIERLSCGYGDEVVIKNFSALFEKGKISGLTGRSGCGKSTVLKAINRLHEAENSGFFCEGAIEIKTKRLCGDVFGLDPVNLRRCVGYVFQSPVPLPMSIEKNVSFALDIAGKRDSEAIRRALEAVSLWDEVKYRLNKKASDLSLGQQQRLAIARVLVMEPEIILFDEPTSSLDEVAARKVEAAIEHLKNERTIVLVSHDKDQIDRICDKVVQIPSK